MLHKLIYLLLFIFISSKVLMAETSVVQIEVIDQNNNLVEDAVITLKSIDANIEHHVSPSTAVMDQIDKQFVQKVLVIQK